MKQPRASIAALMLGIAIAAFPFALLGGILANHPVLGLAYCLDMGIWPGVTTLGIGLASIVVRRGRCGPFAVGFQAAGWAAVIVYVIGCRMVPEFMNAPYVYYVNDVEPYLLNTEYQELYMLGLLLGGCIWGIPQLLVAMAGGVLAALVGPRTIVIGSRA